MIRLSIFYWLLGMVLPIICSAQPYGQVLISEIMADPTPPVGLPNAEYLEVLNSGTAAISLKGWKLSIGKSQQVLPDTLLPEGESVILCHKNNLPLFLEYGRRCGLNTLTLPNDGAVLALYSPNNQLVFSIAYASSWWESGKRQGGYSLEMSDVKSPCLGSSNWKASLDPLGGTPARANSVRATISDLQSPLVAHYGLVDNKTVRLQFSERLDSLVIAQPIYFSQEGSASTKVSLERPMWTVATVHLPLALQYNTRHTLTIRNMVDCAGNRMAETKLLLGLPSVSDSGAVLISEILFNPRSDGVDYVELANHSDKFVNLANWKLGNVRNGQDGNMKTITVNPLLMPPFSYLVVSIDGLKVFQQYPSEKDRRYVDLPQLPSYPLAVGGVVLVNDRGEVMDRFLYSDTMHDMLLAAEKGVALERVELSMGADKPQNWQSASGASGYGTPGYSNSQRFVAESTGLVTVEPAGFSPNHDGVDDQAFVLFNLASPGHFATVTVYNQQGLLVRSLATNLSVGSQDRLAWDGADNQGVLVVGGYYFIVAEVWSAIGFHRQFRNKVVVAR